MITLKQITVCKVSFFQRKKKKVRIFPPNYFSLKKHLSERNNVIIT